MAMQSRCSLLRIECASRSSSISGGPQTIGRPSIIIIYTLLVQHATFKMKTKIISYDVQQIAETGFERICERHCTSF
jgi:hypothetical protein